MVPTSYRTWIAGCRSLFNACEYDLLPVWSVTHIYRCVSPLIYLRPSSNAPFLLHSPDSKYLTLATRSPAGSEVRQSNDYYALSYMATHLPLSNLV
jgi:hypothetical protein